jgi:hypothetical protein
LSGYIGWQHRTIYRLHIIAACAGLAFVGCAQKICLKAVDARTHEPLEGVSVQWLQARNQMFQLRKQEGPTNLPPSGTDGVIRVVGLHRWWSSDFIFACPGYSNVYGGYDSGRLTLAPAMSHYPPMPWPDPFKDQFTLEGQLKLAQKSNGCFLVEMHK